MIVDQAQSWTNMDISMSFEIRVGPQKSNVNQMRYLENIKNFETKSENWVSIEIFFI